MVAMRVRALTFVWLGFAVDDDGVFVLGRLFGGSWGGLVISGAAISVSLFLLFDNVLDVALPIGTVLGGCDGHLAALMHGFSVAATPVNLLMALVGAFTGTIVGLLPGIGPINGVAILLPIAFAMKLPATSALILLAAVYMGSEYGGRITSILVNIPGDAGSVMTTIDGFPMAKKGEAGIALSISAFSSFCGSFLACIGLVFLAPLLAKWALAFGPAEYFVLMVFAIACLAGMVGDSPVKRCWLACWASGSPPSASTRAAASTGSRSATSTCPTASSSWSSSSASSPCPRSC